MASEFSTADLETDGWLRGAIWSLRFCGAGYLLLGLATPLMLGFVIVAENSKGQGESVFMALGATLLFAVGAGCALMNFLVARALNRRQRWGWIGAIVAGAIYAPSGCMPFGALILYAVLRPGFRDAYLAASAQNSAPLPDSTDQSA